MKIALFADVVAFSSLGVAGPIHAHVQDGKLGVSKRREALRELAGREEERAVLAGVRLELESLRIMCDRVSRRERLKRECESVQFAWPYMRVFTQVLKRFGHLAGLSWKAHARENSSTS